MLQSTIILVDDDTPNLFHLNPSPDIIPEDGLSLKYDDLWNKYGFQEGQLVQEWWDVVVSKSMSHDWFVTHSWETQVESLVLLVQRFLVPSLEIFTGLQVELELDCSHNPVRVFDDQSNFPGYSSPRPTDGSQLLIPRTVVTDLVREIERMQSSK